MTNFAITGAAGYIAPRHMKAIKDTGGKLVAALDPHDSMGILDQYGMDVKYFKEYERFERHLEKLSAGPNKDGLEFVSICSPNYLHDAHCRLALRTGADAICEKPLVISPWNLDALQELEVKTGRRIYTVMQLRYHPKMVKLKERLLKEQPGTNHDVSLTYMTPRGGWYDVSWKGSPEKSGGIVTNIGVHVWDLLIWLFGEAMDCGSVCESFPQFVSGYWEFLSADVEVCLSIRPTDPPQRILTIDGESIDLTDGFTDLHTKVYQETLAGRGLGIEDARPAIELAYKIRKEVQGE